MRKIFIDGGANKGQSRAAFLQGWPDAKEYEIHMFEADSGAAKGLMNLQEQDENTKVYSKALWVHDGSMTLYRKFVGSEGNTLIEQKVKNQKWKATEIEIECIDMARWIEENIEEEDYVIMKLDIEGAEYEVMKHLHEKKSFEKVDIFFMEMHGPKCSKTLEESLELVEILEEYGLKPYFWEAKTFKHSEYEKHFYDEDVLRKEYKEQT